MVIVDTSAWIEYFRDGVPTVVQGVDHCLDRDLVGIGDLVYCEVMQGLRSRHLQQKVSSLLLSLPKYEMVGFSIAEKSARNYRLLRSRGVTVRKTIDVLVGTFCVENRFQIIHHDKDFDLMAAHIGLETYKP